MNPIMNDRHFLRRAARALRGDWRPRMAVAAEVGESIAVGTVVDADDTRVYVCWLGSERHILEHLRTDERLLPLMGVGATRGEVLEIVRERWGDPALALCVVDESVPPAWEWTDGGLEAPACAERWFNTQHPSEAHGLVAALEGAP
jgi:hypothetical protein